MLLTDVLTRIALPYWQDRIRISSKAVSYMGGRGITTDTLQKFSVGYNPHGSHLIDILRAANIDEEIVKYFMAPNGHDTFAGYIVFPIFKGNKVVGATGRATAPSAKGKPHLHFPGLKLNTVYNWASISAPLVYVVEAPIDALTLEQLGLPAVATLGTVASKTNMIKSFLPDQKIALVPDNDKPKYSKLTKNMSATGWRSALDIGQKMYDYGLDNVYMVHPGVLDPYKDPNEWLCRRKAKQLLKALVYGMFRLTEYNYLKPRGHQKHNGAIFQDYGRTREDIVALIGQYTKLSGNGNRLKGKCPIHSENTASLVVYVNTNSFCCFGCKAAGGPKTFKKLMGIEK